MFNFYGEGRSKSNISENLFYFPLTNKFFLATLFWKDGSSCHSFYVSA